MTTYFCGLNYHYSLQQLVSSTIVISLCWLGLILYVQSFNTVLIWLSYILFNMLAFHFLHIVASISYAYCLAEILIQHFLYVMSHLASFCWCVQDKSLNGHSIIPSLCPVVTTQSDHISKVTSYLPSQKLMANNTPNL